MVESRSSIKIMLVEGVNLDICENYIAQNFDVKIFTGTDDLLNRSVLGCLRNVLAFALNSKSKLPKYILLVINNDLIDCVKPASKPGTSMIFGRIIQWLADEYHSAILDCKTALKLKAVRNSFPQIFWVALPYHQNFTNGSTRFKFNQSLDTVIPLYNEMRVMKLRRKWSFTDFSVSSKDGSVTPAGFDNYWAAIDEAL